MFYTALILSVILHSALLLNAKVDVPPPEPPPKQGSDETNSPIELHLRAYEEEATHECPEYYVGLGITISIFSEILQVAKDGPAHKAGLKVGDVIASTLDTGNYTPGQEITVDIFRKGMLLSYNVIVNKVCIGANND